ncbi:hypothetical protein SISSUDRAFT_1055020 [Sistotremastrum suecicum HHB10207 ss-3]|uniref:Uncharacterized protein n=1 Tax=Sistotremastrum suecicum HHB10207 ss-3 TaxID=1314776 RepID=A0A165Y2K2_9AGAM|nr:hypothetical protein SISSUDRAFT_1055020 [Sistotremastrum suecicum HHB10207 ss-3]
MILIEASSIPAYDYLQSLSGVDYFLEEMRISSQRIRCVNLWQDIGSFGNIEGLGEEG